MQCLAKFFFFFSIQFIYINLILNRCHIKALYKKSNFITIIQTFKAI